jgi:hypothetical protein
MDWVGSVFRQPVPQPPKLAGLLDKFVTQAFVLDQSGGLIGVFSNVDPEVGLWPSHACSMKVYASSNVCLAFRLVGELAHPGGYSRSRPRFESKLGKRVSILTTNSKFKLLSD